MSFISASQLRRIQGCLDFPQHVRHLALELEQARVALDAAREMLEGAPVRPHRPEPPERIALRAALVRYEQTKNAL
jgi:hypothetical protein